MKAKWSDLERFVGKALLRMHLTYCFLIDVLFNLDGLAHKLVLET